MTENKTLKRRVRERMSKTGERYTAARRQVLAKAPGDASAAEAEPVQPVEAAPPAVVPEPFRGPRRNTDETLTARTGHAWAHWFDVLDAWGASDRSHTEIARWLVNDQGVDGWWAQEITVGFEYRIGRRALGTRADGHVITGTKTINVPVERLYAAFMDEEQRRAWLPEPSLRKRTSVALKSARFDATARERVTVGFTSKGEGKSTIAIEHSRIADEATADRLKALWRERLADFKRILEA